MCIAVLCMLVMAFAQFCSAFRDRYTPCAGATCTGAAAGSTDGCALLPAEGQVAFCAAMNPANAGTECGAYTCSDASFVPGTPVTALGCTFTDDVSTCAAQGKPCQTATCTAGACGLNSDDSLCTCVPCLVVYSLSMTLPQE